MKKAGNQLNIGGATVLLLLIVFSMTIFAVLSLRSSYNELRLSEKARASVEDYYKADAKMEETIMMVYEIMEEARYQTELLPMDYLKNAISKNESIQMNEELRLLTCSSFVDYNKNIVAKLQISDDFSEGFEVLSHKMIVTVDGYDAEEIEIWDGIIND